MRFLKRSSIFNLFSNNIKYDVIYANDYVNICYDACKSCYNNTKSENTKEDKLKYIEKRIRSGHESVIEHSNIITRFIFNLNSEIANEYEGISSYLKYLNVRVKIFEEKVYLFIGGSIRGYKHLFREIDYPYGHLMGAIRNCMYESSYPEFFIDFINAGIFNENEFKNTMENRECNSMSIGDTHVINADKLNIVLDKCNNDIDKSAYLDLDDVLHLTSITIRLENIGRTATHQLVRHRAAITQNSQRYTECDDDMVLTPDLFKDEYKDKKYEITLSGNTKEYTMKELGEELKSVYSQLRSQSVSKEDARYFLPSNIASKEIYMTFTTKGFLKFLELRTNESSQKEIRLRALTLESCAKRLYSELENDYSYYLLPKFGRISN